MDFRGASAEAVAELTDELKESPSKKAAAIGEALLSAAETLRQEVAARRFLTDGSIPKEPKVGMIREVFGSRVDEQALDVIVSAVSRRWRHGTDLTDALERLSEVAAVLSSDDPGRLSDELFEVRRLIDHNPALRDALSDPARSTEDKSALVEQVLGDKVQPATVALTRQALLGSYGTVSAALGAYRTLAGEVHGKSVATVHVASPLSDEQFRQLTDGLGQQYGREIHANVVVDPSVIGGLRVEIGNDVIDGTIASRLDETRRRLAG
ncbi:F0F1 ATP synthase subunit delta [Nocardioides panacisoli]|uniref:ATP synthase subunit delta n=1 Tax=Nocardioides panacisoli TaxID=627624 RepID=A0ABP7IRL9_9ACTN